MAKKKQVVSKTKKKISGRPTKELKAKELPLTPEEKKRKRNVNILFIICLCLFVAIVVISILLANGVFNHKA